MSNDLTIECAAKAGYEHSMKILDFLHPDTQPKFTWETENEACKEEWREKAKVMLEAANYKNTAFIDGHGNPVKHSDLYDECPSCQDKEEDLVILRKLLQESEDKANAEMERVKACEHIAEGDEGWEILRNLCPSTMAVAELRDVYETLPPL